MTSDYLQLAELIPVSPWRERDIGMIATCNQTECMYCGIRKEIAHAPDCPWPELSTLANKFRKERHHKYGSLTTIKKQRWKRNFKPRNHDDDYPSF